MQRQGDGQQDEQRVAQGLLPALRTASEQCAGEQGEEGGQGSDAEAAVGQGQGIAECQQ
ncbi:hypothetical protein D3C84_1064110 [compost metagenome]